MLFFSVSEAKLAGYILPSIPPLALMLGVRVSQLWDGHARWLKIFTWVFLVFSMGMAAAALFFFQREYGNFKVGLILSAVIAGPAIIAFWYGRSNSVAGAPLRATVVQGLILVVAIAQFAFPVLGAYLSTRDIAYRALELKKAEEPIVTYRFFQHSLHDYTGYGIAEGLTDSESMSRAAGAIPAFSS